MADVRARAEKLIQRDPRLCREIANILAERSASGITPQQRKLLDIIKSQVSCTGIVPTYDEMASFMGVQSKSTINRLVTGLRDRGIIRSLPNRPRSIQIIGEN